MSPQQTSTGTSQQAKKPLTWLVTGSSNGMGLALTRHILASGHNVIATSRNPSKTPSLVREIEDHPSGRGRWMALDVSWPADKIEEVISAADALASSSSFPGSGSSSGGLDVVVNNAAYCVLGAVEDVPEELSRAQFETNVWGPLRICKAVLPRMRARGKGTIVNVSSSLGLTTWPAVGMYSSSKFALESISQTLAQEAKPFGVRVLIWNLGSFRTNFLGGGAATRVETSAPYQGGHEVTKTMDLMDEFDGKQAGDPEKAVRVLVDVVSGAVPQLDTVLRLPTGRDSWTDGIGQTDRVRSDFERCKDLAFGVQFDE